MLSRYSQRCRAAAARCIWGLALCLSLAAGIPLDLPAAPLDLLEAPAVPAPPSGLVPDASNNFEVQGVPFRNRSLGLNHGFWETGHQCSVHPPAVRALQQQHGAHGSRHQAGAADPGFLSYTPNRLWPADSKSGRTALVMAIGGPVERFTARMQVGWHGLLNSFLARLGGGTTLILLLDADFPSSLEGLAADLGLRRVDCAAEEGACAAAAALDDGYRLFTATPGEGPPPRQPVVVLLSKALFPAPWWALRNGTAEAAFAEGWRTAHCGLGGTPYLKTKFLNWYAHDMFKQLRVLDYFDYWMKLDDDVRWAAHFPGDITHHLITKRRTFFHMGVRREKDLDCLGRNRFAASKPARLFLDMESDLCRRMLSARGARKKWFYNDTVVLTSEFAGGWLGFFTAPEVLLYGALWSQYPGGIWEYRWGDQQFWKTAVGLFGDGSHVEDVSYVREAPKASARAGNETAQAPKHFLGLLHHD